MDVTDNDNTMIFLKSQNTYAGNKVKTVSVENYWLFKNFYYHDVLVNYFDQLRKKVAEFANITLKVIVKMIFQVEDFLLVRGLC